MALLSKHRIWQYGLTATIAVCNIQDTVARQKPNILVIFGDDVGQANISAFTFGVVGYKTPHIDRLAKEGMMFTDYYAENSCTAGRSTFITGQCAKRTGLSKVGIPGAPVGDWLVKNDYIVFDVMTHAIAFLETFKEYPPSQLPASFSIDQIEDELNKALEQKLKPHAPGGGK